MPDKEHAKPESEDANSTSGKQAFEDLMAIEDPSKADYFVRETLKGLAKKVEYGNYHQAHFEYIGDSHATLTVSPNPEAKGKAYYTSLEIGNDAIRTCEVTTISFRRNADGNPVFEILVGKCVSGIVLRVVDSNSEVGHLITLDEIPMRNYELQRRPNPKEVHAVPLGNTSALENIAARMTAPGDHVTIVYPRHHTDKPVLLNETAKQLKIFVR